MENAVFVSEPKFKNFLKSRVSSWVLTEKVCHSIRLLSTSAGIMPDTYHYTSITVSLRAVYLVYSSLATNQF